MLLRFIVAHHSASYKTPNGNAKCGARMIMLNTKKASLCTVILHYICVCFANVKGIIRERNTKKVAPNKYMRASYFAHVWTVFFLYPFKSYWGVKEWFSCKKVNCILWKKEKKSWQHEFFFNISIKRTTEAPHISFTFQIPFQVKQGNK